MRLGEIYRIAVEAGMECDPRSRAELERSLARAREERERLEEDEKAFFDEERFANPYDDTRIVLGDADTEVRGLLCGIDMEVGEVLLADRLREKGQAVDLILAHHPEGPGLANMHRVMRMQADLWHRHGVGLGTADALISDRAAEIDRRIMPVNHYRSVDAARLLGLAMMSCHTPADNCVTMFVQDFLDSESPDSLRDVVKALRTIPEYEDAARKGAGPKVISGDPDLRPGKTVVDMTGGTEGPKKALDRLSSSGVDTLVGMHYTEEHREKARELKMNLVIAGHISSDAIGMNLILDQIEGEGVEVICASGMVRVDRQA